MGIWKHLFPAIRSQFSTAHCYVNTTLTSEDLPGSGKPTASNFIYPFFTRQYFVAYAHTQRLLENCLLKQGHLSERRAILLRKASQDSSLMLINNIDCNTDAMTQDRLLLTG